MQIIPSISNKRVWVQSKRKAFIIGMRECQKAAASYFHITTAHTHTHISITKIRLELNYANAFHVLFRSFHLYFDVVVLRIQAVVGCVAAPSVQNERKINKHLTIVVLRNDLANGVSEAEIELFIKFL